MVELNELSGDTRERLALKAEDLLHARTYPKTICPSEIARAFTSAEITGLGGTVWRDLMVSRANALKLMLRCQIC